MVQLTFDGKVINELASYRDHDAKADEITLDSRKPPRRSSKSSVTEKHRRNPHEVPSGSAVDPRRVRHPPDTARQNSHRRMAHSGNPEGKSSGHAAPTQWTKLPDQSRQEPVGKELDHTMPYPRLPEPLRSVASSKSHYKVDKQGYGSQYPEQYGSRAMYDQSYYYYYQKYMEQHPYYREYNRQYYSRNYGYPGGNEVFPDEKSSVRSGRSSVNEELKKSTSSLAVNGPYEYVYRQPPQSPYHHSDDVSGVASLVDEVTTEKIHRLTPQQFGAPHFISKFTPGGKLLVVLPYDPKDGENAIVQIRDIQQLLATDSEYGKRIQHMKNYAGPIAYNDTHKDVVIRFCAYQISEASSNNDLHDKQSVILLWEYLSLLVKQNGKVCGADLASLLLEQKSKSASPLPQFIDDDSTGDANSADEKVNVGSSVDGGSVRPFTEHLCLGRRKEAVEYAIRHGLWGHAMMLASKMDQMTHTRVMTAFLNSIPTSDVLQTAIQHMSGKRPDVTKNFNPDRWGDWREHLAVLVSNSTGNSQRDRASIIGLGDTLAARGQLHAAHICYIAGEAPWGAFEEKSSKIVLIGSSHNQSFETFVSEEAFQCTEVYEYAKSLDGTNEIFHKFQSYKLIYALRLAECGFPADALRYCEVVSTVVCQSPQYYPEEFMSQVLELASRLKFYDAHYQMGGEVAEMADPEWLQRFSSVIYGIQVQNMEAKSSSLVEGSAAVESARVPKIENVSSETEKHDVTDNANVAQFQTEMTLPQSQGYQLHQYENNYKQVTPPTAENYPPATAYQEPPLVDVNYQKPHDVGPPYDQTPPVQLQEPTSPWQQTPNTSHRAQSDTILAEPLQRRSSEEESYWASMANKPTTKQPVGDKKAIKSELKEDEGTKDSDDKKQGFFGSFFGWKKSNQAKLPDDSNPSIVWDESKKKWVNKDGEEETESPPPPPPAGMMAPPTTGGSFRGGNRVYRYVDPVGDKRRSSGPQSLPPNGVQPGAHMAQNGGVPAMSPVAAPAMSPVTAPAFLPPVVANENLPGSMAPEWQQHTPVHDSISNRQAADGDSGNPVPMMGAPPMFNPNQFSATSVPSTGSLPRKAGPARRAFGQR